MATFVVVWGGVIGWAVIAVPLAISLACVLGLVVRTDTRWGRLARSIARARLRIERASPGERVVVFGRVEVDGAPARRFDDLAPCALASLETAAGPSIVRSPALFLRSRGARIRLSGAVSIEATTDTKRVRGGRVASLSIGEYALVVGRAQREVQAVASGYRQPVFAVAIRAADEPIDVVGTRRLARAMSQLASVVAAPAIVVATLGIGLASASLANRRWFDDLGGDLTHVPAHLAIPLMSPMHRADALDEVNRWLVWQMGRDFQMPREHLVELGVAIRDLVPDCEREALLALAVPGQRARLADGCDAVVGARLLGVPSPAVDRDRRMARWDDIVVSLERAPMLGMASSVRATERDEWELAAAGLRRPRARGGLRRIIAQHLRRLAIVEAVFDRRSSARRLADAARAWAPEPGVDDRVSWELRAIDVQTTQGSIHEATRDATPLTLVLVPDASPAGARVLDRVLDAAESIARMRTTGHRGEAMAIARQLRGDDESVEARARLFTMLNDEARD